MTTIEQSPQVFHPAFNPCYFVLDSDNKTETGFRYIVEIEVSSTIIATYRVRPLPVSLLGEVDISKALQTMLDNDFQELVSYDAENHYINYNLVLSEEYFVNHSFFGARVATGSGTWNWVNWGNTAINPTGANQTMWASLTEPPFVAGDVVVINQVTGLLPALEGTFTVLDKVNIGGTWFIVVDLPWIGGGVKSNTAVAKYANGLKFREEVATSDTFTAWRGAFRFAEFPNYDNEKYLLNGVAKELLTSMPDAVRISRTTQTRFALRFGQTFNFWVFADWSALGVTNQSTFITWVEANSDYTVDSVTDFSLVGTELKCNIAASGGMFLELNNQGITEIKAIGNGFDGLTTIALSDNNILFFDPILPLPNSLHGLSLNTNNLTIFNPDNLLPNTLTNFDLQNNNISNWDLLLPWITAQPTFTSPCTMRTASNPTSAVGTAFETAANLKNATIVE